MYHDHFTSDKFVTLSFPGSTTKKKTDGKFEEKAEIVGNSEKLEKKRKYSGLCIPDNPMWAKELIIPEEDSKEAQKTTDEVRHIICQDQLWCTQKVL